METWREVFRRGIAPHLSTQGLVALRDALASDSPRLVQGAISEPPPLAVVADWPCEKACAIGYCGWQDGCETVSEVEEFFIRVCTLCDDEFNEPAACRWWLNWFDDTPRGEMRAALLPEVELALAGRLAWDGAANGELPVTSAGSTDRGGQSKIQTPQRGEPSGKGGFLGKDSTGGSTPAPNVKAS